VLLAVNPLAIYFDGLIQKTVLDTFLLSALLLAMGYVWYGWRMWTAQASVPPGADKTGRPVAAAGPGGGGGALAVTGGWLLVGAALGLLMLVRENAAVLLPVLAVWLLLGFGERSPRPAADSASAKGRVAKREPLENRGSQATMARLHGAAALAIGMAIVLLPVATRNLVVGGEFHLTTSQLGPNFHIGNNPQATGVYRALLPGRGDPRFERHDATALAQQATGRELSPGEVSRYWLGQSLRYIADQPGHWLRLIARKAMLTINAIEVVDTEDPYTYAEQSWVLRVLLTIGHFGVLLPLAVLAAALMATSRDNSKDNSGGVLLWAMAIVYAASVVMFFVMGRYRYPLVVLLIPLIAWGLVELWGYIQRREYDRRLLIGLAAAALAAVVANWPIYDKAPMQATTHFSVAVEAMERMGATDEVVAHLHRAVNLRPEHSAPRLALAVAYVHREQWPQAAEAFETLIHLHPNHVMALHQYAQLLLQFPPLGQPSRAVELARHACDLTGHQHPESLSTLAAALEAAGEHEEAHDIRHLLEQAELEQ
jgi:tetratricopeptide (TPR) repeat protein